MPSSSTRSTWLERQIRTLHRQAFTHLWTSRLYHEATFLNRQFALALDMAEYELRQAIKPVHRADSMDAGEYAAELAAWRKLQAENARLGKSDRVFYAGNAVTDAGAVFSLLGRGREGREFCRWGEFFRFIFSFFGKPGAVFEVSERNVAHADCCGLCRGGAVRDGGVFL